MGNLATMFLLGCQLCATDIELASIKYEGRSTVLSIITILLLFPHAMHKIILQEKNKNFKWLLS